MTIDCHEKEEREIEKRPDCLFRGSENPDFSGSDIAATRHDERQERLSYDT